MSLFLRKHFLFSLVGAVCFFSLAPFASADTYIVTLEFEEPRDQADVAKCVENLCSLAREHGDGSCEYLSSIDIATVDFDITGIERALTLSCVVTIEGNGMMYARPRGGRSN